VEQLFGGVWDAVINNGKISYIEGIMLDITERKIAEDAIKKSWICWSSQQGQIRIFGQYKPWD
jgi:hypothetical protein